MTRDEFFQKLDTGWSPPEIPKAEYQKRVREQIGVVVQLIMDAAPDVTARLTRQVLEVGLADDSSPLFDELLYRAECARPGLVVMYKHLVLKEVALENELSKGKSSELLRV